MLNGRKQYESNKAQTLEKVDSKNTYNVLMVALRKKVKINHGYNNL